MLDSSPHQAVMLDFDTILGPLHGLCKSQGLRFRWKTYRDGERWKAEVQAGQADENWKRTGAFPRWGGSGDTEADALADAARNAISYWTRPGLRS